MSSDMEDSTRLTNLSDHRQHHYHHHHHHHHHQGRTLGEFGDDECSTDSGCSSGGSTGRCKRLSRRSSDERPSRSARSPRSYSYLERPQTGGRSTRSQDRGGGIQRSLERAWSPEDVRSLPRDGVSPSSYSSSPSDVHSNSDSDSLKRTSTAETLRRAFQSLKITSTSKWDNKEKKHAKKSPKRILRSPVSYMYVRGLSGLPTQRVPRNTSLQQMQPYSCQDLIGLYR